jgi:ABC-type transport system substrate-binding protein
MIVEQWRKIGIRGEVQEMERGLATARMRGNEHQIYFETQWGADNVYGHQPLLFPTQSENPLGPQYGVWYASAGRQGKEPPARMRELMAIYRRSVSVPDQERTRLAKEVWKIALDELWLIPVISNSPASQGVRVIKNNLGNVPERRWNSAVSDNPHVAHTDLVLQVVVEVAIAEGARRGPPLRLGLRRVPRAAGWRAGHPPPWRRTSATPRSHACR